MSLPRIVFPFSSALVAGALSFASHAHAELAPPKVNASADATPGTRVLATAVAVVPGAVVHGLGHVAKGDPKTGRTLMLVELGGLAGMGGGLAVLVATGASRRLVLPAAALTVVGAGLFFTSYLADIYGSARSPSDAGTPSRVAPLLVSELGYRYVNDPNFAYRSFLVEAAELRLGRVRLKPEGWHALNDRNARIRLEAGLRLTGPLPSRERPAPSGSFLDVDIAATRHTFSREAFHITTGEIEGRGRYDLADLAPSLRGSFVEGSLGVALASYSYAFSSGGADANELLLGSFAYGAHLGRGGGGRPFGEAAVYYDHRHDGFTGGFKMAGLGSGVPGHFGLRGLAYLTPSIGIRAELEAGSAIVGGASLLYRVDP